MSDHPPVDGEDGGVDALTSACVDAMAQTLPRVGRIFKGYLRDTPLTIQQMHMLQELHGGSRPSDLARRCSLSSSATTAALDGLVQGGYCVRAHSERDRREVLVRITPRGEEALISAHASASAALRELLAGWDVERMRRLLEVFQELQRAADGYLEQHSKDGHAAERLPTVAAGPA